MIRHNISDSVRWVKAVIKQIPFAQAQAMNATLFDVRKDEMRELKRSLSNPTRYTMNSVRVKKATKRNLIGEVFINNTDRGRGTSPSKYLEHLVFGRTRDIKRNERAMKNLPGAPPGKPWAVPSKYEKVNKMHWERFVSTFQHFLPGSNLRK